MMTIHCLKCGQVCRHWGEIVAHNESVHSVVLAKPKEAGK